MKKIKLLLILLIPILLTGCSTKKYDGTLNVLNWTSYIPDEVIENFEKEYNIKVNYGTYSSNEELLAKVTSSKEGTYDVIFPSDYMVDLMIKRDVIEKIDITKFKNLNNIDKNFLKQEYDKNNEYSLPFLLATSVIAYDNTKVDKIAKYEDLLNKDYYRDIVMLEDQRIVIGAMLQALGYDLNDTNDEHLEEAYNFYLKLKDNIKAFDSDSPKTFLITQEVDLGLMWSAEAILAQDENPHIKIVYPEDGYALSMDNYTIVKDSKNKDNAYLFIDYLLRNDVCEQIIDEYPYISPNKNVGYLTNEEVKQILANGSYIRNVGSDIKKLDKLWARMK